MSDVNLPRTIVDCENEGHDPSVDFGDVGLADGWLMIWRPPFLKERPYVDKDGNVGKIIMPAEGMGAGARDQGPKVEYMKPNCAMVVKAGEGCKRKPGDYVFWVNRGFEQDMPQPLIPNFRTKVDREDIANLYVLKEEKVIAFTSGRKAAGKSSVCRHCLGSGLDVSTGKTLCPRCGGSKLEP